ncbi:Exocyst complex subunit Exo70, C-terminal [Dillenia turbinata]|uniref:Exocyst subunit Exo70 family protein n=1 Tax=Dillenia turbinata TaxID=194707 RepID=A0AAN8V3L2_9MAGN
MRKIFKSSKHSNSSSSISSSTPSSSMSSPLRYTVPNTPLHTFSESVMAENVENARLIITKWDLESSSFAKVTSLFYESRREAKEFLNSVKNLQRAMHYYVSEYSNSQKLIEAQQLMQTAMKRLEKEFYQILASNRDHLDLESTSTRSSSSRARSSTSDDSDDSEDEFRIADESIKRVEQVSSLAMSDLKAIADCMISTGYGKECVKIYKIIRKSIVDEGLYHLGVDRLTSSQINKLEWEVLDIKIKNWLKAINVAVKTLFSGERILCDYVFAASASIRESCFTEITKDGANLLFGFPELVAKTKKSPEKMFRMLDIYEAVYNIWPEIQSIFSLKSTSAVQTQALNSLIKLGEAARGMLTEFESAIQKESSKTPVPGGGIHPLTRYVMNYMSFLTDYKGILSDTIADWPLSMNSPMPESYFCSPESDDSSTSAVSVRLAWLILVLLCKLDVKAELYKDVALSYLFLANNLQYVVEKVKSSNLRFFLGEDWLKKHEGKVKQYASNYERMGWSKVMASLPENPTADAIPLENVRERYRSFNSAFAEACSKQTTWIVTDSKLRDEIKLSLARKLVPLYRGFYNKYRDILRRDFSHESIVRYAPDDLGNYLSDLLYGNGGLSSTTSSVSSASASASISSRTSTTSVQSHGGWRSPLRR